MPFQTAKTTTFISLPFAVFQVDGGGYFTPNQFHWVLKYILSIALALAFAYRVSAQESEFRSEGWVGYITSLRISDKFAMWNDFHYVPNSFWINRHGLTYVLSPYAKVTGGYAFVLTATSFTDALVRHEHRPWAQYEIVKPFNPRNSWRARLRYDRRIREAIENAELVDSWTAYNRWRLMLSWSHQLKLYPNGRKLHLNLLNEILINQGSAVDGVSVDQNRTYVMLGFDFPTVRIQAGPHIRAIPGANGVTNYRGGITLWVIQRFSWPKWPSP